MPRQGNVGGHGNSPHFPNGLAPIVIPSDWAPGLNGIPAQGIGIGSTQGWSRSERVFSPQHQKGLGDRGLRPGLPRARGPEARRVAVHGPQDIH